MTPTRRPMRMFKYIIKVNTVGANVGANLLYLNFINIKQQLNASKWRRDSPYNYLFKILFLFNYFD